MKTPWQYAETNNEHSHAVALMMWASHAVKLEPRLKWLHAIPNGGFRDNITAGQLKAEGVKRGISDYFLPVPIAAFTDNSFLYRCCGLYIELKRIKTKTKSAGVEGLKQDEFRNDMVEAGYHAEVCYGWQSAIDTICKYLDISKARLDEFVLQQYAANNK